MIRRDDRPPATWYRSRRDRLAQLWHWLGLLGRGIFVLVMVAMIGLMTMLAVNETIDANEPVVWGTFRETEVVCGGRGGCTSYGTWESDDGSLVQQRVGLNGEPDAEGTARAAFRPGGFRSGDEHRRVDTEQWVGAGPWMGWSITILCVGVLVFYGRRWWLDRD